MEAILRQHYFRMFFKLILGPSWVPKGGSNGAQVGPKTDQNRRRKRRCKKIWFKVVLARSWSRLGPIFGLSWPNVKPSWGDLGVAGGREFVVFRCVFQYFLKYRFCALRWSSWRVLVRSWVLLGRSWGPLGPILARLGRPRGPKREPKTTPKRHRFLSLIFDPILVRFRGAQGSSMAPQGGGGPRI